MRRIYGTGRKDKRALMEATTLSGTDSHPGAYPWDPLRCHCGERPRYASLDRLVLATYCVARAAEEIKRTKRGVGK